MTYHTGKLTDGRGNSWQRQHIRELLGRYPDIGEEEDLEILQFLRKGPHLDVGILMGSEELKPKLDAFVADHKSHFRLGVFEMASALGGMVGLLVALWLLWIWLRG